MENNWLLRAKLASQYELRSIHSQRAFFECLDLDPLVDVSGVSTGTSDKAKWAQTQRLNHYCVYLLAKIKGADRQAGSETWVLFECDTHSVAHQEALRTSLESLTGIWRDFKSFEKAIGLLQEKTVSRVHEFYQAATAVEETANDWDKNQNLYEQLADYANSLSMMLSDIEYIQQHPTLFSHTDYVNQLSRLQNLHQTLCDFAALTMASPGEIRVIPADLAQAIHEIAVLRPQQILFEKVPVVGNQEGVPFDDAGDSFIRASHHPRYFVIHETEQGLGVGVYYQRKEGTDYRGKIHGLESEKPEGFYLGAGEYVNALSGTFVGQAQSAIRTLAFTTNLGRTFESSQKANEASTSFQFKALPERALVGFHGFSNLGLQAIGPVYAPLPTPHHIRSDVILGGPKGEMFGSVADKGVQQGTLTRIEIKMSPMTLDLRRLDKIGQLKFSIISGLKLYYTLTDGAVYSPDVYGANPVGGIDIFLDSDEYILEISGAWLHFSSRFPLVGRALANAMGEAQASDYLLDHINVRTNKRVLHNLGGRAALSAILRHVMTKRHFSFVAPRGLAMVGMQGRATSVITAMGALYRTL